ncbi:MAG TPA: phosphatase PAP2 family protein [Puia sp.]|nr:phosphatase PAP2 family protein [Puia sp.]
MAQVSTGSSEAFYSNKNIFFVVALSAIYLGLSNFLIGFKPEQVFLVLLFSLLYFASAVSRKFILAFSIFIVYWIIFDWMKAFPNYRYQEVHIRDLYMAEKKLFGISFGRTEITPNEYWLRNGNTWLDILAGLFYLTWVPVPLLFAAFLFFKNRKQFFYFSLTFFLVNLIGFVIYYSFPAAPPWYVQQHGFVFQAATPGSTAGLSKFDHFFNAGIFKSIYTKSSNVFAAMPSLHSSYPVIVLYYGLKNKMGAANILFTVVMLGIWFSAVYASHHYVLDVLMGIACAVTGISLFELLAANSRFIQAFINRLVTSTT